MSAPAAGALPRAIRYVSLFSGIGSDALAMRDVNGARFECVGYSEVDRDALAVYAQHFPAHTNLGDVTEITAEQLRALQPIDLVVGGSPCQGFSQAGKRQGLDDPRSRLFWHFVRVVRESGARYVLLENVASMKREHRQTITEALREVKPDLNPEPVFITSALLTAQNRRRLYWANFPIGQPEDARVTLGAVVQNMNGAPPAKPIVEHQCNLLEIAQRAGAPAPPFAFTLRRKSTYVRVPGVNAKVRDFEHVWRTDGKSNPCICTVNWTSYVYDGSCVRRLTIREFETLQGFPPGYTAAIQNETKRRKLVGNAFTVPVFRHLLQCLAACVQ